MNDRLPRNTYSGYHECADALGLGTYKLPDSRDLQRLPLTIVCNSSSYIVEVSRLNEFQDECP